MGSRKNFLAELCFAVAVVARKKDSCHEAVSVRIISNTMLQDDAGLRDEVAKQTLTTRTSGRVVSGQLGVEQLHREDSGCAADSDGFDSDVPAAVKEVRALFSGAHGDDMWRSRNTPCRMNAEWT